MRSSFHGFLAASRRHMLAYLSRSLLNCSFNLLNRGLILLGEGDSNGFICRCLLMFVFLDLGQVHLLISPQQVQLSLVQHIGVFSNALAGVLELEGCLIQGCQSLTKLVDSQALGISYVSLKHLDLGQQVHLLDPTV